MRAWCGGKLGNTIRAVAAAFLILLTTGCGSLFFFPERELAFNPLALRFAPEDVFFPSGDGLTLHGWLFRAAENRGTVLVLHGNAENLSTHVNSVLWLVQEGYNIFIFDYRGYGRSEGKPGIEGVHLDAAAALRTVLAQQDLNLDRFVVLGQSIGGAVAVYTVATSPDKLRVKALIIDSAFSGYRRIAREKLGDVCITWPLQYPLSFLVGDAYSPVRWISKVSPVPVLILHGQTDPIVPLHHGRTLYEAAGEPKFFWQTTPPGHIRSFADPLVRVQFTDFISRL